MNKPYDRTQKADDEGAVICSRCTSVEFVLENGRVAFHTRIDRPGETCEGSGRFPFHMFGTRMRSEGAA